MRILAAITDYETSYVVATLILVVILLGVLLGVGAILIAMMHRQRSDLAYARKIVAALIELSLQLEHEDRRTRHAVKNLCTALTNLVAYMDRVPWKLDFSSIERSLEEPPDFQAPHDSESLIRVLEDGGDL